jgi:arginine deiminase
VKNLHLKERLGDKASEIEFKKDDKPFVNVVKMALGLKKMRVIETGGNAYM